MENKITLSGIVTAILLFILPFAYTDKLFYGGTNAAYFWVIFSTVVLGLLFSYKLFNEEIVINIKKRPLLYSLGIVLLVYYLSSFLGAYLERSLWSDISRSTGVLFLSAVFLFSIFTSELLSKMDWSLVRKAVACSGAFFAFLTFFGREGLLLSGKFLTVDFTSPGLTFGNSTFAGSFLVLSLIITIIEVANSEKGSNKRKIFIALTALQFISPLFINWQNIFSDFTSILSNPLNLIGHAQASGITAFVVVGFATSLFVLNVSYKGNIKSIRKVWTVIFTLVVLALVFLVSIPNSPVQNILAENSTANRFITWRVGWEVFQDKLLFGWGPENFRYGYEKHFDNKIYEVEGTIETWWDKPHNVLIDNLSGVGVFGFLAVLVLLILFTKVVLKAQEKQEIKATVASLLVIAPAVHLMQLQTSFNTPETYFIWGVLFGFALWLEKRVSNTESQSPRILNQTIAVVFLLLILVVGYKLGIEEYGRQKALIRIFNAYDISEQLQLIDRAFQNHNDFEAMRLMSSSLIKGTYSELTAGPEQFSKKREAILAQMDKYEELYKQYLSIVPTDYRTRLNYVYVLMTRTIIGEDRLSEAKELIEGSYKLSPNNPLTYVMDSIITLYSGRIEEAKNIIQKSVDVNPQIEFTQKVQEKIVQQEANLPNIDVIRLENL